MQLASIYADLSSNIYKEIVVRFDEGAVEIYQIKVVRKNDGVLTSREGREVPKIPIKMAGNLGISLTFSNAKKLMFGGDVEASVYILLSTY